MGTRVLAVTLSSQLVALITGSADSPADRASTTCGSCGWAIRMLPVLCLRSSPSEMRVVNSDMLLKLLESIMRVLGQAIKPCVVKMARRDAVGEQGCGGYGVVWGETVQWIRQHLDSYR